MSTAASSLRSSPAQAQPRGAHGAPGGGGVALDPVRLLKKYYTLLIGAMVAGAVLGVVSNFVLAKVYPQYTSYALFVCNPQVVNPGSSLTVPMSQDELARMMGTQMMIMTSTPVLDKVLDDYDVQQTKWAKQFFEHGSFQKQNAQPELEKALSTRAVSQTQYIRLSMTWRDPEDVRTIVDSATKIYQSTLRQAGSATTVGRRQVLNDQIEAIKADIENMNARRDKLLGDNKITDINAGLAEEDIKTKDITERYGQTVTAKAAIESQYVRYRQMQEQNNDIQYPDDIRGAADKDPLVLQQDQEISALRTDYDTLLRRGVGPQHLDVITLKKRLDAANQERQDVYDRTIRKLFNAEVDGLLSQSMAAEASLKQENEELNTVAKRKQDLIHLRLDLQQIQDDVRMKTEDRASLERQRKDLDVLFTSPVFERVTLQVPAQKPESMSFPQLKIMIPLGVVLIAGLTGGLVVLREILDQRVRGPADLSTMARVRVLGLVSDVQEDPTRPANLFTAFRDAPTGVTAESFRLLRAPVVKAMDQQGHKSLLILAGMPGSGGTTVATNLGLACAGADERVLIIDANLRRPGVQKAFGLPDGAGLGDVLAGAVKLDDAVRPTSADGLFVLTSGSAANRTMPERLASESMARVLTEAKGKFDRIIIDSAPAIVSGDGFALANRVDAVALVVRALNEKRGLVARLRNQLGECRGEFLGVIVNAVRASSGGYLRGNIKATHEYQHGSQAA